MAPLTDVVNVAEIPVNDVKAPALPVMVVPETTVVKIPDALVRLVNTPVTPVILVYFPTSPVIRAPDNCVV